MAEPTRSRAALPLPVIAAATVLALLAAGAVLWIASEADSDSADVEAAGGTIELTPDEGDDRPPLEIPVTVDDTGEELALDTLLDGRPMVVNFFASWCPPCVSEMPDFEEVHQDLGDRVRFVGLSVDDSRDDEAGSSPDAEIVERTGVTYEWYQDRRGDVINATGAVQMPTTMFIDADGRIVELHSGALDAGELRDMLDEHLGVTS